MNSYDYGAYAPTYGSSINNIIGGANNLSVASIIAIVLLLIIGAVTILVCLALYIYLYVFTSLSLQKIASRRRVSKPWFAWIPIFNVWLLGAIANDYDRQNGKNSHWGSNLLIFYFTYIITYSIGYFLYGITRSSAEPDLGILLIVLLIFLISFVFAVINTVMVYICYYKLFKSTAGNTAIVYFLISLFVPIAQPLCLFLCRNKGYPYVIEEPENII